MYGDGKLSVIHKKAVNLRTGKGKCLNSASTAEFFCKHNNPVLVLYYFWIAGSGSSEPAEGPLLSEDPSAQLMECPADGSDLHGIEAKILGIGGQTKHRMAMFLPRCHAGKSFKIKLLNSKNLCLRKAYVLLI
jgi:hypothetical protein